MGKFADDGNILVANQSKNVLVNYNFMLRVEGIYDLPCKSVHSFTKENEFEYVQEGGLNDYVHMLRKPVSKPFSFTVERYVGMDIIPPLALGAELILPVILMVSPYANQFGNAKRTFVFTGCTVMSKTYGELNAEKSDLLTETIVIGYREMTEVTLPVHERVDDSAWNFLKKIDKDKKDEKATVRQWPGTSSAKVLPTVGEAASSDDPDIEEAKGNDSPKSKPGAKPSVNTGEAEVRQWPKTSSAKQMPEVEEEETEGEGVEEESGKGGAKPSINTGAVKVRKWPAVSSAKTYADVYGKDLVAGKSNQRSWPPTKSARQIVENNKET